jgi:hypothetical protein
MKNFTLLLLLFIFLIPINSNSQTSYKVPSAVIEAFKDGSAKSLGKYFDNKLQLVILDEDDICKKSEAEKRLSQFFLTNKPKDFNIQFEGGRDSSQYAVCILKTDNKNYRVTLLLQNNLLLHIRIEEEFQQ